MNHRRIHEAARDVKLLGCSILGMCLYYVCVCLEVWIKLVCAILLQVTIVNNVEEVRKYQMCTECVFCIPPTVTSSI